MPDVLVHRCTVRVVRRRGWSWGADPRRLLREVIDAIPALVAAKLEEIAGSLPDGSDVTQPLRIRVPVRLQDLIADRGSPGGAVLEAGGPLAVRIGSALDRAVRAAVPDAVAAAADDAPAPAAPDVATLDAPAVLAAILRSWRERGLFDVLLGAASFETLEEWLHLLTGGGAYAGDRARAPRDTVARPDTATTSRGTDAAVRAATAAALLRTLDPAAAPSADHPPNATVTDPVATPSGDPPRPLMSGPPIGPAVVARKLPDADTAPTPAVPRPAHTSMPAVTPPAPLLDEDVHVSSALPWLVIAALHRIGYLRALRAAVDVARVSDLAALFGAAIAYKLSRASARAWRKSDEVERLAAAVAAQRTPVSKAALHGLARRLGPQLPMLDGHLAHAVATGKDGEEPWLLEPMPRRPHAVAVLDSQGLFPAWWDVDAPTAAAAVHAAGAPALLGEVAAGTGVPKALSEAGVRFFTTARPGRGETWVRLPTAPDAWWSNQPGPLPRAVARQVPGFGDLSGRAATLCAELTADRLAMPLDPGGDFERSITLAVAVALGTIAWELWHNRESTDPLLTLARLEDLDARVRFSRRSVRVVVPLGRRHRDLYEANLLNAVPDLPWLGGRPLEFSGG